tara:strand:+ start:286 stop:906 length:621 start_codon:yes stop_codon:yes gene_type:complete
MASPLGILEFQKAIRGGVRPNLFKVEHAWPSADTGLTTPSLTGATASGAEVTYLCKSAALPATNIGTVELPFRGRVIKVPGDRTYETWTATFYMDDAFKLRAAYEKWIELTNAVDKNTASTDIVDTWVDIKITQLDKFGGQGKADGELKELRTYRLASAFPVSISQVSLAYDNNDSYEEFDVEFAYQYHTSVGKEGGNDTVDSSGS